MTYFERVTAQNVYGTILYKLYSLQLNCTYSNFTEAAATCLAGQKEGNCEADGY